VVYEHDPDSASDADFEAGALSHAVIGNAGRMLDARRTPVRVVGVRPETGHVLLEILAFEDAGAHWEVELERIDRFQFARGSARASPDRLAELEEAVERFDRPLRIDVDPTTAARTHERLAVARAEARDWLRERPVRLDLGSRSGDSSSWRLLETFLAERGLIELEQAFAERWVSNPGSGELVRGHRIVVAELGLAPYVGKVVRDPRLFDGPSSREHRAEHLVARLAFVPELFRAAGRASVTLWRGLASEVPLEPLPAQTFVSGTFAREVAEAHFEGNEQTLVAQLSRHVVPVERLFMTYAETEAMNRRFLEAEAVVLGDL